MTRVLDIPCGHIPCNECFADPQAYLKDFEAVCPSCDGSGHYADPEFIDPDDVFDPVSEWGTYRTINGRVA